MVGKNQARAANLFAIGIGVGVANGTRTKTFEAFAGDCEEYVLGEERFFKIEQRRKKSVNKLQKSHSILANSH